MIKPDRETLALGSEIRQYRIESVLGAGGFAITYRALDLTTQQAVVIKEYFPVAWSTREDDGTVQPNTAGQKTLSELGAAGFNWGLNSFLDEARILQSIEHDGVVRVHEVFSANGTAYLVMTYEPGETLSQWLDQKGRLNEAELRNLLDQVLDALQAVHQRGYLHRDLKPSNLYRRTRDQRWILIDFGAARQAVAGSTGVLTAVLTPGYAPIEQHQGSGEDHGPWTDLYALGAIAYRCIAETTPINAPSRVFDDPLPTAVEIGAGRYHPALLHAIDRALEVRVEDRFLNVIKMRSALAAEASDSPNGTLIIAPPARESEGNQPVTGEDEAAPTKTPVHGTADRQRRPWITLSVALMVLAGIVLAGVYYQRTAPPDSTTSTVTKTSNLWTRLKTVAEHYPGTTVRLNQPTFIAGEAFQIDIELPQAGYLNVVTVNARDQATVLFPNPFHPDNQVAAGQLTLPTDAMRFNLVAAKPFGPSLIVALLSKAPLNLFANGEPLVIDGQTIDVFRVLSNEGETALREVQALEKADLRAGFVETRVCERVDDCTAASGR